MATMSWSTKASRSNSRAFRVSSPCRSRIVGSRSSAASRARVRRRAPPRLSSAAAAGSPAERSRGGMPRLGWLTGRSLPCAPGPRRYDGQVAGSEPGESRRPNGDGSRRLVDAASARYASAAGGAGGEPLPGSAWRMGPLARASIVAIVGAVLLFLVGAILASTAGLLFVAGLTGAGIGLMLARARVPADGGSGPLSPRAVTWLAIGLAIGSVVVAAAATWLFALREGGVLGPIDYLLTVFGPFVPG